MTGRPSTKIQFQRAPTPDFPLPLFLVILVLFSMLLFLGILLYVTFSSLDPRIRFDISEQLTLGFVGMTLPMLTTYMIIKGKPISRWFAMLQIVMSAVLFAYMAREEFIGVDVSEYIIQLVYGVALIAICYLFFSAQMRAYYRWLKGKEGDENWVSVGRLKLAKKMENVEQTVAAILEGIFILFALAIFVFMLIPHFWK